MRAHSKSLALLSLFATTAFAEQMYVDDKLVLNVYAAADQKSARVATIQTGDAVEALERIDKFVRVQLPDGREGWVGASYLSVQPPAVVKLRELQSSGGSTSQAASQPPKQLLDDLARLKKQSAALQSELADLKKKSPAAGSAATAASGTNAANSPNPASASMSTAAAPPVHAAAESLSAPAPQPTVVVERSYWWAWALAVVVASGVGFIAGYATLGRRVRQRFGGVKVY